MHELSIASSLISQVQEHLADRERARVKAVGIRVGGLVDLSLEALDTGFQIARQGTVLADATLEIESVPIAALCRRCQRQTDVVRQFFLCAHCLSSDVEITSGLELDLAWIDLDDESAIPEPTNQKTSETGAGQT